MKNLIYASVGFVVMGAFLIGAVISQTSYTITDTTIDGKFAKAIQFPLLSGSVLVNWELFKSKIIGDGELKLMAYQNVTKRRLVNEYECDCKKAENKTDLCDICREYEFYIEEELMELPNTFILDKNMIIYEVFYGCEEFDIMIMPNGWGCSVYSNLSIAGIEIRGASWWNETYQRKKPYNVSVSSGTTEAGYQILINITNMTNIENDCSDIRFTNESENALLDYWIELYKSGEYCEVWVEIDVNLSTNNYTIWKYYDPVTSVSSASNGEETFLLFDDFEDNSFNNSKWIELFSGCNETGGHIFCRGGTGGDGFESVTNWYSQNVSFIGDISLEKGGSANTFIGFYNASDSVVPCGVSNYINYYSFGGNDFRLYNWNGANIVFNDTGIGTTTTYDVRVSWTSHKTYIYMNQTENVTLTLYIPDSCFLPVRIYASSDEFINVSWIGVTKFNDPQPNYWIGDEISNITPPTPPLPAYEGFVGILIEEKDYILMAVGCSWEVDYYCDIGIMRGYNSTTNELLCCLLVGVET